MVMVSASQHCKLQLCKDTKANHVGIKPLTPLADSARSRNPVRTFQLLVCSLIKVDDHKHFAQIKIYDISNIHHSLALHVVHLYATCMHHLRKCISLFGWYRPAFFERPHVILHLTMNSA